MAWAVIACGAQDDSTKTPKGNEDALETEDTTSDTLEVVPLFSEACTGDISRVEPGMEVIRGEESFRRALEETEWVNTPQEQRELPEIDFEHFVVIAAYAGYHSQCRDDFFISEAVDRGEYVEIKVTTLQYTGQDGDDAMTWPYAFVQVPRLDKEYRFVEEAIEGTRE